MRMRVGTTAMAVAAVTVLGLAVVLAVRFDSSQSTRTEPEVAGVVATSTPEVEATGAPVSGPTPARFDTRPSPAALAASPEPSPPAEASRLAWVELDRYAIHSGESVRLRAGGFEPGERVQVGLRGRASQRPLAELEADQSGSLEAAGLVVPPLGEGSYALVVAGERSGLEVERRLSLVGFDPWVVLNDYTLAPGSGTGLQGFGLQPGEAVEVFLDGSRQPIGRGEADRQGELRIDDLIQATPADVGKHRLTVRSEASGRELEVEYEVLPFFPVMTLVEYAGPPGSEVRFNGDGFAPGERVRIFVEQGTQRQEIASFQADQHGGYQHAGPWPVPYDARAGELRLVAQGDQSRVERAQTFKVIRHEPWVRLDRAGGAGGTRVSLQGSGFGAKERVVVSLDGRELGSSTTDGDGAFANLGPLALPDDASGELELTARGERTGIRASAIFTIVSSD